MCPKSELGPTNVFVENSNFKAAARNLGRKVKSIVCAASPPSAVCTTCRTLPCSETRARGRVSEFGRASGLAQWTWRDHFRLCATGRRLTRCRTHGVFERKIGSPTLIACFATRKRGPYFIFTPGWDFFKAYLPMQCVVHKNHNTYTG